MRDRRFGNRRSVKWHQDVPDCLAIRRDRPGYGRIAVSPGDCHWGTGRNGPKSRPIVRNGKGNHRLVGALVYHERQSSSTVPSTAESPIRIRNTCLDIPIHHRTLPDSGRNGNQGTFRVS